MVFLSEMKILFQIVERQGEQIFDMCTSSSFSTVVIPRSFHTS